MIVANLDEYAKVVGDLIECPTKLANIRAQLLSNRSSHFSTHPISQKSWNKHTRQSIKLARKIRSRISRVDSRVRSSNQYRKSKGLIGERDSAKIS